MSFWSPFEHFTSKQIDMNPYSGINTLCCILGEYEPFNVLCWQCKGLLSGSYDPKIGYNCMKFDILGDFSNISTSQKLEMNTFSISTILRRLLGEFEPSSVFYCYCKELSSWSWAYGPKIGQNCIKYDVLGTFRRFHFKKDRNESIFWQYYFMETFERI